MGVAVAVTRRRRMINTVGWYSFTGEMMKKKRVGRKQRR